MTDATALVRRGVETIRAGQSATGAYVACPTFAPYRYCWLRDGSFVADAMSRAGEPGSAEAFFDWATGIVLERDGERLAARYSLDGREDESDWPRRQWDGWGLWLWAVAGHCERHGVSTERWADAADLAADFLADTWHEPCTDWWEERDGLHAVTLGCVAAGLGAWERATDELEVALHVEADWRLDASLLALVHPLGLVPFERVVPHVEALVSPGGGVHRHLDDSYYGGGEWLLLTALLGWVEAEHGRLADARRRLDWVVAHATPDGDLPEQSPDHLLAPDHLPRWVAKWGPPPSPLLWSHALAIDLTLALQDSSA